MIIQRVNQPGEQIARKILTIQVSAYEQEAKLIGVNWLPPMNTTVQNLCNSGDIFFVTYVGIELVGAISIAPETEEVSARITSLVVLPDFHRRGIATRLLIEALSHFGCAVLTVQTAAKNVPALALYARFGFRERRKWMVASPSMELVDLARVP